MRSMVALSTRPSSCSTRQMVAISPPAPVQIERALFLDMGLDVCRTPA